MKLNYRGTSYDYNPPTVPTYDSGNLGTYRGLDVRFRNPQKALVLQPTLDLKYRGVGYRTGDDAPVNAAPVRPAAVEAGVGAVASTTERARALMLNRSRQVGRRQQAMLGRAARAVGLEAVAAGASRIQGKLQNHLQSAYALSLIHI